jgi:TonB family protein
MAPALLAWFYTMSTLPELDFGQHATGETSAQRRVRVGVYALAVVAHVVVLAALARSPRPHAFRLGTHLPGSSGGIGAFVEPGPRPTATTGRSAPSVTKVQSAKTQLANKQPPATPRASGAGFGAGATAAGASAGPTSAAPSPGPVRLGANLGLVKKVNPAYPPRMEMARTEGTVVVDAVIHRDGTVGDVTVLKSSAPEFERAAVEAVKQWRYTPLPYEGIATITINFTLNR